MGSKIEKKELAWAVSFLALLQFGKEARLSFLCSSIGAHGRVPPRVQKKVKLKLPKPKKLTNATF
jgi:hypothetical protein